MNDHGDDEKPNGTGLRCGNAEGGREQTTDIFSHIISNYKIRR